MMRHADKFLWVAGLLAGLAAGCGPLPNSSVAVETADAGQSADTGQTGEQEIEKFKGTEVKFTEQQKNQRHFKSESSPMTFWGEGFEGEDRYQVSVEDSDSEDSLELGVASVNRGFYGNENARVRLVKNIDYQEVEYREDPIGSDYCSDNSQIQITGKVYGMTIGQFSALLCKDDEEDPGPEVIEVSGRFATWVTEL